MRERKIETRVSNETFPLRASMNLIFIKFCQNFLSLVIPEKPKKNSIQSNLRDLKKPL